MDLISELLSYITFRAGPVAQDVSNTGRFKSLRDFIVGRTPQTRNISNLIRYIRELFITGKTFRDVGIDEDAIYVETVESVAWWNIDLAGSNDDVITVYKHAMSHIKQSYS